MDQRALTHVYVCILYSIAAAGEPTSGTASVIASSSTSSSSGIHHVRVRKPVEDKAKRRQLLLKARADRVRKKAEVSGDLYGYKNIWLYIICKPLMWTILGLSCSKLRSSGAGLLRQCQHSSPSCTGQCSLVVTGGMHSKCCAFLASRNHFLLSCLLL